MNKPRKPSQNVEAFERELKRLSRIVKTAQKKGIVFIQSPLPEKPKRITQKQIAKLRAIKPPDIYSKGFTINQQTGEFTAYETKSTSKKKSLVPIGERVSISNEVIKITIPSPKKTPEELHEIRSEAAKKAQQTIKKRIAEDPEYAKRMHEIRVEAARKAREAIKKRIAEDPEYAKRMHEIRVEAARKVAKTRAEKGIKPFQKKDRIEELAGTFTEDILGNPYIPEDDIAEGKYRILDEIRSMISTSININIANYLLDLLEDEIIANGLDVVADRIATAQEQAKEMAQGVQYESGYYRDLYNYAASLARLIVGGDLVGGMEEEIEQLAFEDRPYMRKVRL